MNESQEDKKKEENIDSESSGDNESLYSQESIYRHRDDSELHQVISEMTKAESMRYETFRRSNFPKAAIKKFINVVIGQAVNPNIVIGVSGLCKVFIGEMVVEAKRVQNEQNESGPLLPSHIHEAYRRLYKKIPNMNLYKKAPWG